MFCFEHGERAREIVEDGMETTLVVTLALLAWLLLPLPLAIACGRSFDLGSRSEDLSPQRTAAGTPRSPRA